MCVVGNCCCPAPFQFFRLLFSVSVCATPGFTIYASAAESTRSSVSFSAAVKMSPASPSTGSIARYSIMTFSWISFVCQFRYHFYDGVDFILDLWVTLRQNVQTRVVAAMLAEVRQGFFDQVHLDGFVSQDVRMLFLVRVFLATSV